MCTGNPNLVMALAGNKADLAPKRKIEAEVCKILAVDYLHLCYMHILYSWFTVSRTAGVLFSDHFY